MARAGSPKTGIQQRTVLEMKVMDSVGVEYELTLTVDFERVERLLRRLFKSSDGSASLAEGALIGKVVRTGKVYPVDKRAVVRRRVRDGATEEVPGGAEGDE